MRLFRSEIAMIRKLTILAVVLCHAVADAQIAVEITDELAEPQIADEDVVDEIPDGEVVADEIPAAALQAEVGGVQAEQMADQMAQVANQQLQRVIEHEFSRIKRNLNVSDEQLQMIRKNTQGYLKDYVNNLAKKRKKLDGNENPQDVAMMMASMPSASTPDEIQNRILGDLEPIVDKKLLEAFKADVKSRQKWYRRVGVDSMLGVLNVSFATTSAQEKQIEKVLSENYNDQWVMMATAFSVGDMSSAVLQILPEEEILELMTDRQKVAWKKQRANSSSPFGMVVGLGGDAADEQQQEKQRQQLREKFRQAIGLKIDCLDREYSLSDRQKKKLQLVGKGSMEKALVARQEALDKYQQMMVQAQANADGNFADFAFDMELMIDMSMPASTLLETKSDWLKFVRGTLNDGQRAKYDESERNRKTRTNKALMGGIVAAMSTEISVDAKQLTQLHELMVNNSPAVERFSYDIYFSFFSIPEAKFKEILSEEQWATFQPQWAAMQQQLEMMEKQKAKREQAEKAEVLE